MITREMYEDALKDLLDEGLLTLTGRATIRVNKQEDVGVKIYKQYREEGTGFSIVCTVFFFILMNLYKCLENKTYTKQYEVFHLFKKVSNISTAPILLSAERVGVAVGCWGRRGPP